MRATIVITVAAACLTSLPSAARTKNQLTASWTTAVGFDSNPNRVEPSSNQDPTPTAFQTGILMLTDDFAPCRSERFQVQYLAATKLHFSRDAKSADIFLHRAALAWIHSMRQASLSWRTSFMQSRESSLTGTVSNSQPPVINAMDFLTASTSLNADMALSKTWSIGLSAAGNLFRYAPDDHLSFEGWTLAANLNRIFDFGSLTRHRQIDLVTTFSASIRRYHDQVDENDGSVRRSDVLYDASERVSYVGAFLAEVEYHLSANLSNAASWSVIRHRATIRVATALPWHLFAVARITYQYLQYPNSLLLYAPSSSSTFLKLDEESRSSALVSLQRHLGPNRTLQVRYVLYADLTTIASHQRYLRHIAMAELSIHFE
ncbi:MAG: hypothetical protein J7M25_14990 [Deltaproteobacteria bacterium]|nr:hypothetical protein [Deltaproteobacteria bacterium]